MRLPELVRFAAISGALLGLLAAAIDLGRAWVGPMPGDMRRQLRIESDVNIWQAIVDGALSDHGESKAVEVLAAISDDVVLSLVLTNVVPRLQGTESLAQLVPVAKRLPDPRDQAKMLLTISARQNQLSDKERARTTRHDAQVAMESSSVWWRSIFRTLSENYRRRPELWPLTWAVTAVMAAALAFEADRYLVPFLARLFRRKRRPIGFSVRN